MRSAKQRRRTVPRAKYTKPPKPLPAIEHIQRSKFRFRNEQWRKLTNLLPPTLAKLGVPRQDAEKQWHDLTATPLPERVKSIADFSIQVTEHMINSHLTTSPLVLESPMNPANIRAAIRRLRTALKPFINGWVDNETASLVSADLDAKLAARDQEVVALRIPTARRRTLTMLCQGIEIFVRHWASANGEKLNEQDMLRYIDRALNFANIKHPNITKHRPRLVALVFPKD
jgi:hypothetical protein